MYRPVRSGFTMVEMAVVLVVIGIITAMAVSMGIDTLQSARRSSTLDKIQVIDKTLAAFRARYGRLPCPADAALATSNANFGIEAANGGSCTGGTPAATYLTTGAPTNVPSGAVPVKTLGLSNEFMFDGFGGKFMYEVTPAMTADNAFSYSQPGDSCSITVVDASGNNLAIQPVYALVSHGRNGIGAYLASGSRQTSGTAGTAEQTNIRGTTTTPTIRIMNGSVGAMGTSGYYDDVVSFTPRYLMLDALDKTRATYSGPEMILLYDTTSGTQAVYGKRTCGEYKAFSGSVPAAVAAAPKFAAFTSGNTNLFVYHTNSCKFYSVIGTTLSAVTETTPVPNCPAAATKGAMAKDNGMLALNSTSAPYLRVYRMVGSGAAAKFTELANALLPALSSAPDNVSFSGNGEWMAVAKASTYARLYKLKDGLYQDRGTLPSDAYTEYSNAISPNGKYYAITQVSGGNTQIYIWRNVSGEFSQITSGGTALLATITGMTAPSILTFSPNSDYLAVAGTSSGNNLVVYALNQTTEALASSLAVTLSAAPSAVDFSLDGRFLAVARGASGANSLSIYRRNDSGFSSTADTNSSSFSFNGSANATVIALSR